MTMLTWMKEFYPVSASSKEAQDDPLGHAFLKFKGLKKKNLKRHGITVNNNSDLVDEEGVEFPTNGNTCALCRENTNSKGEVNCFNCSLYFANNNNTCYADDGPFDHWTQHNDPKPMLKLIKRAEKMGW